MKNAVFSVLSKTTVGARILLINDGKILLVKHTYMPGWYTIGGGVDASESPLQAIHRELKEEVGVTLKEPPKLFSVYHSVKQNRDDYVVLYVANDFEQQEVHSNEILDKKWFKLDLLPEDISPATKRRIDEYLGKIIISDKW
jgi:8-oxo-dGTP pyrophosphatase MutT (NUDIX family)